MPNYVPLDAALPILSSAKRISVVGVSGAGKSTLSLSLSKRLSLAHVSLDRDMRWLPGWQVRDRAEQRRLHDGFVAMDRWVIDGTSIGLMDTRLPRSDLLIWLRMPRRVALAGLAKRVATSYGQVRPDMADGCPERLPEREFVHWIWTFEKKQAPRLIATVDRVAPKLPVLVLQSRREVNRVADLG